MKKYVTTLFLLAALNVLSFGQSCSEPDRISVNSVTGIWQGAYSLNGEFINFIMTVDSNGKQLSALLDIPELNIKNISYQARIYNVCSGQELRVKNTSIDSSIEFIASPKDNGTMTGRVIFRQNGEGATREVFTAKRTSLVASK